MKLKSISKQKISDVKLINFERFMDHRGYFTETFRASDFINNELNIFPNGIMQTNESFSQKNVFRGLHFQWNPNMGKLVRTIAGHMVDLILDLRIEFSSFLPSLKSISLCKSPCSNSYNLEIRNTLRISTLLNPFSNQ